MKRAARKRSGRKTRSKPLALQEPDAPKLQRWMLLVMAGVLLAGMLGIRAFSRCDVIDDAYISFRYTWNLVHGNGYVFNPGQRVEGATNFLWAVLLAVPMAMKLPVAPVASWLGLAMTIGAVVLGWRLVWRLTGDAWSAWLAMLPVAWLPAYVLAGSNGLAGGMYSLLMVATIWAVIFAKRPWIAGMLGGLTFMTRPESMFIWVVSVTLVVLGLREASGRFSRRAWRDVLVMSVPWLVLAAALTAFRWFYFGELLPNSVLAKRPPSYDWPVFKKIVYSGLAYVWEFVYIAALPTLGLLAAPLIARRRIVGWFLLGIFAAACTVTIRNGGDWMPYHRLLIPYAVILGMALGLAIAAVFARIARPAAQGQRPRVWLARGILLAVVLAATVLATIGTRYRWQAPSFALGQEGHGYHVTANAIRDSLDGSELICPEALGEAACILIDNRMHDSLGLIDKHIARNGRYWLHFGRSDFRYTVKAVRPDIYMTHMGLLRSYQFTGAYRPGRFLEDYAVYMWPKRGYAVMIRRRLVPKLDAPLRSTGMTLQPPQVLVNRLKRWLARNRSKK